MRSATSPQRATQTSPPSWAAASRSSRRSRRSSPSHSSMNGCRTNVAKPPSRPRRPSSPSRCSMKVSAGNVLRGSGDRFADGLHAGQDAGRVDLLPAEWELGDAVGDRDSVAGGGGVAQAGLAEQRGAARAQLAPRRPHPPRFQPDRVEGGDPTGQVLGLLRRAQRPPLLVRPGVEADLVAAAVDLGEQVGVELGVQALEEEGCRQPACVEMVEDPRQGVLRGDVGADLRGVRIEDAGADFGGLAEVVECQAKRRSHTGPIWTLTGAEPGSSARARAEPAHGPSESDGAPRTAGSGS